MLTKFKQVLDEHVTNNHKSAIVASIDLIIIWAAATKAIPEETLYLIAGLVTIWTGIAVGHHVSKGKKE